MKPESPKKSTSPDSLIDDLAQAICELSEPTDAKAFLRDLCTPTELEAMADRWSVVPLLIAGQSYRQIHQDTGVSLTTIGRVARTLKSSSGYHAILDKGSANDNS